MAKQVETHAIVTNLYKIMNDRKLGQKKIASMVGFPESKLSKIFSGMQNLTVNDLSKIASSLNMREIDIITYPKVYRETNNVNNDVKAQLTIELKDYLKENVLKLIFGNDNLELINKIT